MSDGGVLRPRRGPRAPRGIPRGLVARHHTLAHGAIADPAALLAALPGVPQGGNSIMGSPSPPGIPF